MGIGINTNVMSLNAQRNLSRTSNSMATSLQRLSSGLRVNSAKDDAAGLAIAERMNSQVRGLTVGIRNANDGISLSQTAEAALGSVTESLQRMRELAVQAVNGTNSTTDRASLDAEFQALDTELTRVINGTEFNDIAILSGGAGATIFQIGADTGSNNQITVTTTDMSADTAITTINSASVTSAGNASTAIASIDAALTKVNSERGTLGAAQSSIESAIRSLSATRENITAARGRIMDTDFAVETANLTRTQILQQAGISMLAQANSSPQIALSLLQ